jgi:hypothetical protein
MKKIASTIFCLLFFVSSIYAQDLKIFDISDINEKVVFVSLSDIYPSSEKPDLPVIPEDKRNFEHVLLDSKFRKQFLSVTKISETDNVFLYDYAKNKLASFTVKKLNAVANLSQYEAGSEPPHSHYDYQIGFEIDKKLLKDFGDFSNQILVYVGKENPFAQEQMIPISWKKTTSKDFPSKKVKDEFGKLPEKYSIGDSYSFKFENFEYFIQNFSRDKSIFARRLLIQDTKTKAIIYEEIFSEGESDSLTPLNFVNKEEGNTINQWTGKLFKNKEPVIFGFEYHSFGCDYITVLSKRPTQVDIYCDNRH